MCASLVFGTIKTVRAVRWSSTQAAIDVALLPVCLMSLASSFMLTSLTLVKLGACKVLLIVAKLVNSL